MMNPQDKTSITPLAVRMNEAAKMLNIGRTSLHHLIKSGQIPYTKINRAVLFRVQDLEDFLKKAHKIKV
jgi:excisionase family DNA binding protein